MNSTSKENNTNLEKINKEPSDTKTPFCYFGTVLSEFIISYFMTFFKIRLPG